MKYCRLISIAICRIRCHICSAGSCPAGYLMRACEVLSFETFMCGSLIRLSHKMLNALDLHSPARTFSAEEFGCLFPMKALVSSSRSAVVLRLAEEEDSDELAI